MYWSIGRLLGKKMGQLGGQIGFEVVDILVGGEFDRI